MRVYLAGLECNAPILEEFIRIADSKSEKKIPFSVLTSYASKKNKIVIEYIDRYKDFMLDSGAFTFFSKSEGIIWEDYVEEYGNFVKKKDIKKFFELDIDSIVGYKKVIELRRLLEETSGKKCIPVWHKSRGIDEFIKMCKEYDYVSIGGIVSQEIRTKDYQYLNLFINTAHKYGAKIHGLGFTKNKYFDKVVFDSVDSTSWNKFGVYGQVIKYCGGGKLKLLKRIDGYVRKNTWDVFINNTKEYIKFISYCEEYL